MARSPDPKHALWYTMVRCVFVAAVAAGALHGQAQGATVAEVTLATEVIKKTAAGLCTSVRDAGSVKSAEISGKVELGLKGLLHQLANIGVSAEAKQDVSQYQGVVQSDLATALRDQNECKLAVMTRLLAVMFPSTPSGAVEASYIGYRPSAKYDRELSYFLEVSGARQATLLLLRQFASDVEEEFTRQRPGDMALQSKLRRVYAEECESYFDRYVKEMEPIYRRYFGIDDLRELNKFYSTPQMRRLVARQPEMIREAVPILQELGEDMTRRIVARMKE